MTTFQLPIQNDLHDGMAAARIAGYSWPEIHQYIADRQAASQAVGYSDAQLRQHMGLGDPAALNDRLTLAMQHNLAENDGR